jgi:hypothetical protein
MYESECVSLIEINPEDSAMCFIYLLGVSMCECMHCVRTQVCVCDRVHMNVRIMCM